MDTKKLEKYYSDGHRCRGAGYLRFILMAFICFWNYGFPEPTGALSAVSGFAIPCFYILSGYFVLPADKELSAAKTANKLKRTAFCFAFLLLVYIVINVAFCITNNVEVPVTLRVKINFLALNLWPLPIGGNIMFIQSMLYAYLVIFIAQKLNLMRFYKPAIIITLILLLLTGEFAGLINFNFHGYYFIPANWLTRALPYILIGKLLREKEAKLLKIKAWKYILAWITGAFLSLAELFLLAYTGFVRYQGHMIGFGIMAVAACGLAISRPEGKNTVITRFDTALSGMICIFMDPLYYLIGFLAGGRFPGLFSLFGGLAALAVSILLALVLRKNKLARILFTVSNRADKRRKIKQAS